MKKAVALGAANLLTMWLAISTAFGDDALPVVRVEGQPLAANVRRVVRTLEMLGQPLPAELSAAIEAAAQERDYARLQTLLDPRVLLVVAINPEARVKVERGPATAALQQG